MNMRTLFDTAAPVAMPSLWKGRPMIVDSFAGGGGASTGIEMALGRSPDIAINHNPAALALHAANHPETLHLSENVYKVDPLDHMRGKHIGLMHFSPDCKHFSKAKGGKPVERNIRDLAWIIPGWIERIQKSGGKVDVVTMENVEEWKDWGPLVQTERGLMPCPDRRGQTFDAWCKAIRKLGGKIDWRELRACDYGAPTIRKRLFLIVRFDGKPIVWPEPTHGDPKSEEVISGRKLPWRGACEIIDWSLPCPSIFDSKAEIWDKHGLRAVRPLADNTMARVARGMKRYVLDAERPFLVSLKGSSRRARSVDAPHPTVCAEGGHSSVISPSISRFNTGATGSAMDEPLSTITANSYIKKPGGAAPVGMIAPVITYAQQGGGVRSIEDPHHTITASGKDQNAVIVPHLNAFYGPGAGGEDRSADVSEPLRTITTENRHAVIVPTMIQTGYGEREGQAPRALDIEQPLGTIVAGGVKHAVVVPTIVGCGGRAGQSRPRGGDEPVATLTTKADGCVATAFVAQQNNDSRRIGGVNPGRAANEPLSTVTATGAQQSPVTAFIARQFGNSTGHAIDEPLGTVTADVNKSQLVAPFFSKYYGTGDGARHDEPCHTITVNDRFGHVETSIEVPPFRPEQEARAREVADFMRSHGFWDEREFVTLDVAGQTFVIVDIGMRMLSPRELFNAQGFPPDYAIDGVWEGEGDARRFVEFPKDVQVSCCGNSVSPFPYAAIVAANCGDLVEVREAAE
jgi:DNA (cytosine-5)-methyltransferase 1